jgi:hypothetical protein
MWPMPKLTCQAMSAGGQPSTILEETTVGAYSSTTLRLILLVDGSRQTLTKFELPYIAPEVRNFNFRDAYASFPAIRYTH